MDGSNLKWYMFPRWTKEFEKGVDGYIEKSFATEGQGEQIRCPCKVCCLRKWFRRDIVKDHMIAKGFVRLPHEETLSMSPERVEVDHGVFHSFDDNVHDLLNDTYRTGLNEETKNFYKLVEEGQEELYPGCKNFSKLSFIIRLFVYKRDHKLSNGAFTDLLKIIKDMQPDAKLPSSFNEAKNVLKVLGLDYIKIDACPNDCMLFWEDNADATFCHTCKASRWKKDEKDEITGKHYRISTKVLRYFPIKKRLQRMFMCPETARYMTWHAKGRPNDGLMRHFADGDSWKNFDLKYPSFAEDPRNVRLSLSSDGFNPFSTMSIAHSTWPVILSNCNLPSWMSMKSEFLMLALLIPGPSSPGNDIDVYMQPLVRDLKDLWEFGIETYDASTNQMFKLHVALMFTISDFPAYAMLSGWSTKGQWACPNCHYETRSKWLPCSNKMCYMEHYRFLEENHSYRRNKRLCNGQDQFQNAPSRLTGAQTLILLSDFENKFGKFRPKKKKSKGKSNDEICPWKKRSIFFDLPYWMHIDCRHFLDVMHIEKNICDSVIGTLLDIPGKTKDHIKARMDLTKIDILHELKPKLCSDGERYEISKSRFWMTLNEQRQFCTIIKNAKVPQACDSNIARCVQVKERKIAGYKSHDAHFLMQYLLPIVVKATLQKSVAIPLIRLSAFFKAICNKVLDPQTFDHLQSEIAEILCQFEMIFPPAFFDIMLHLPVHLVEEIRQGGPVCGRWMYPVERNLHKLKAFVRNKSRPEGSIAEAYLVDECVTFCARYLQRGSTTMDEHIERSESQYIFPNMGHPIMGKGKTKRKKPKYFKIGLKKRDQAHRYALFNCNHEEVKKYISDHETLVNSKKKRKWDTAQSHSKDFIDWFRERVEYDIGQGLHVSDCVKWLSVRPSFFVKRYSGYAVNGYKFHTQQRDRNCVTENSGVTLTALTPSFASTKDQHPIMGDVTYYGSIEEIIEIFYEDHFSVVLFGCVWFHSENDSYGLSRVNHKKLIYQDEPFILASQAHQVFYVQDPSSSDWSYVVQQLPRDHFDVEDKMNDRFADLYWKESHCSLQNILESMDDDLDLSCTRVDIPATIVDKEGNLVENMANNS